MGRPARILDVDLAQHARDHMQAHGLSMRQLADMVDIDKSTLSRSLEAGAFSQAVLRRLKDILDPAAPGSTVTDLVRKALRLREASDRLRERADRLLIEALDQSSATK